MEYHHIPVLLHETLGLPNRLRAMWTYPGRRRPSRDSENNSSPDAVSRAGSAACKAHRKNLGMVRKLYACTWKLCGH